MTLHHCTQVDKSVDGNGGKSGAGVAEEARYKLRLLLRDALDGNVNTQDTAGYLYGTCDGVDDLGREHTGGVYLFGGLLFNMMP